MRAHEANLIPLFLQHNTAMGKSFYKLAAQNEPLREGQAASSGRRAGIDSAPQFT
jgi:hypothetical protein